MREQFVIDMLTDITERLDKVVAILGQKENRGPLSDEIKYGQISIADVAVNTLPEADKKEAIKVKAMLRHNTANDSYQVYFRHNGKDVHVGTYTDKLMIEAAMRAAEFDPMSFIRAAEQRAAERILNKQAKEAKAKEAEVKKMERELVKKEKEAEAIRKEIQKRSK